MKKVIVHNLVQGGTVLGAGGEDTDDELTGSIRNAHIGGEVVSVSLDAFVGGLYAGGFKGRASNQEGVHDHTHGPDRRGKSSRTFKLA